MKTPEDQPAFNALVTMLDDALLSLREKDRTALLLRYYESHSLRDVGAAFGVSEDTARKRVQSALEKLSDFFKRRGFETATVAATAAGQAAAIRRAAFHDVPRVRLRGTDARSTRRDGPARLPYPGVRGGWRSVVCRVRHVETSPLVVSPSTRRSP